MKKDAKVTSIRLLEEDLPVIREVMRRTGVRTTTAAVRSSLHRMKDLGYPTGVDAPRAAARVRREV